MARGRGAPLATVALLAAALAGPARAGEPAGPGGYAAYLDEVVARWRPTGAPPDGAMPLRLTCLTTPGQASYVGALQEAVIEAPLSEVTAVLDDVPHYRDLFPGTVDVKVVPGSRDGDRYVTEWEQKAPVFFLPNTRYQLAYQVDRASPARAVYRYWLHRPGSIRHSDGLVILEPIGPGRTRFTEYDFFEAAWGPVPMSMVWSEALKGMFLSDVALELKAEHPGWSYAEVAAEARRRWPAAAAQVDRCRAEARPARALLEP